MAVIALRTFQGEIPKLPAHLLPENAAQQAEYCDLSHGYLAPLKSGLALKTVGTAGWTAGGAAVNSLFTLEGTGWYTSSTTGIEYFRSPVIDEIYNRIYFLSDGNLKVSEWDISQTQGGPPATSVKAGVPAPTVAPTLVVADLTSLPDHPLAAFSFEYWYEFDGIRHQLQSISALEVTPLKKFAFSPVEKDVADEDEDERTPADAVLTVSVELKEGTKQLFKVNTSLGATTAARTQALPGGVEISLERAAGGGYYVNLSWGVVDTRAYVYTVVNGYNEESAPSPAALISPTYIQEVQITTTTPSFTGYKAYSDTNIYRTFGGTAAYLKIEKTAYLTTTWKDRSHNASSVGTALATTDWRVPPTILAGLKLLPNGWFAAFNGNTVYFSEPFRPHTWPYSMTFPRAVRGLCVGAQNLVVTTFDETYVVSGPHPASAMQLKLPVPVGGASHIGMTNIEGAVAFISNDGIVLVEGTRASLEFSQKLFTRTDWRTRYGTILSTMKLSYHDGFLIGTSPTISDALHYGFVVRIDEGQGYVRYNKPISAAERLPVADTLYFSTTDDGLSARNIYAFNEGSAHSYTWWSKDFIFPQPVKMGAIYIRCSGSVPLNIYVDGVIHHSATCSATGYYRIPPGEGLRWSVSFTNVSANIYEFVMAQTMGELRGA